MFTATAAPPGRSSLSTTLPPTSSTTVKVSPRPSRPYPPISRSLITFSYSYASYDARSATPPRRPRNFARKKAASGSSTRIPSYTALPSILPRNSINYSPPGCSTGASGLGYSCRAPVSFSNPRLTSAEALSRDSRNSLKRPPPSMPASTSPWRDTNVTLMVPRSSGPSDARCR